MRGLLEKDIRLAGQRKGAVLLFVVVLLVMGLTGAEAFLAGYGTMLFGILAVGTLSYDEFDNCFPFLLTLPITRKEYVQEKFLFCGGGILLGWLVSAAVSMLLAAIRGTLHTAWTDIQESAAVLPVFCAVISIMLPLQMKYNVEKSRIVLLILGGLAFAVSALAVGFGGEESMLQQAAKPAACLPLMLTAAGAAVVWLMYCWSLRILEKKEW